MIGLESQVCLAEEERLVVKMVAGVLVDVVHTHCDVSLTSCWMGRDGGIYFFEVGRFLVFGEIGRMLSRP